MTISMGFPLEDEENKKELLITKGDEVAIAETGHDHGGESTCTEFKPIEHPLEPTDEDHPVKCPMHNTSILNNGETRLKRSASAKILRKRPEFIVLNEGTEAPVRPHAHAVRKRHQTLPRNRSRPPLSRSTSGGILQRL